MRLRKGLTSAALAAKAGLSPGGLRKILYDGSQPSVNALIRIAEALRVMPGHLLVGVTSEEVRD